MALDTIGSIAIHILTSLDNVPTGVSGNMVQIVDMARQHVENYVGVTIGSNNISAVYQPAIVDFAKADTIDFIVGQGTGENITLADLSISNSQDVMSADAYRKMGEFKLKSIGKKIGYGKSLS